MTTTIIEVSNLNNCGNGSLREAINISNTSGNTMNKIIFNISGTIYLNSNLPNIISPVEIYNGLDDGIPTITIDGKKKYKTLNIVKTKNSIINGICVINSCNSGISIIDSTDISIYNCWIGIDTLKNISSNNSNGIEIINSSNCIIGSNPSNIQNYYSNVISGNNKNGIYIYKSYLNLIQNNIIGLNSDGTKSNPNKLNGITIIESSNNIIGGKAFIDNNGVANNPTGNKGIVSPVFVRPLLGNLISGNKKNGIKFCYCLSNEVKGNFIGTNYTGNGMLPNQHSGISIYKSKFIKILGCNVDTNPFIYYNVISGNTLVGINIIKSKYTLVQGNFIGLGANNSSEVPNYIGIIDYSSTDTIVGGIIPLGNVVAGNLTNGFHITKGSSGFTSINTFCGNAAFGPALPNGTNGFLIDSNAQKIKLNTNVISGNNGDGINITGDAKNIILASNLIGIDANDNPIPNIGSGIVIGGNVSNVAFDIIITSIIPRNTISCNGGYGIVLKENSHNNILTSLFVGLNYTGIKTHDYSNTKGGILITDKSNNNSIGNSIDFEQYSYISDKYNFAIKLTDKTYDNIINYNFINVNISLLPTLPHGINIINSGINNITYNNNIPYE